MDPAYIDDVITAVARAVVAEIERVREQSLVHDRRLADMYWDEVRAELRALVEETVRAAQRGVRA